MLWPGVRVGVRVRSGEWEWVRGGSSTSGTEPLLLLGSTYDMVESIRHGCTGWRKVYDTVVVDSAYHTLYALLVVVYHTLCSYWMAHTTRYAPTGCRILFAIILCIPFAMPLLQTTRYAPTAHHTMLLPTGASCFCARGWMLTEKGALMPCRLERLRCL